MSEKFDVVVIGSGPAVMRLLGASRGADRRMGGRADGWQVDSPGITRHPLGNPDR